MLLFLAEVSAAVRSVREVCRGGGGGGGGFSACTHGIGEILHTEEGGAGRWQVHARSTSSAIQQCWVDEGNDSAPCARHQPTSAGLGGEQGGNVLLHIVPYMRLNHVSVELRQEPRTLTQL